MKKIVHIVLLVTLIFTTFYFGAPLSQNQTAKASFDPNNLVADAAFINVEGISAAGIQDLFNTTGTFLKTYSENGRSAARIVYDAAHGYGDASGALNGIDINSSTGTINPVAILATLQKEQGLVTGGASVTLNQSALNAAMGYGCPDGGGCNDAYVGFTKQIENAAWQLRYNYERAQGHGFSDYQVGQTATIDGQSVTYSNRATASLYRYTPHLGQNFTTYFNLWSTIYQYSFVSQSAYPTIRQNETAYFNLTVRNTGSATWTSSMHLGTDRGRDRVPGFIRGNTWSSANRITMLESSVAPGETATFRFTMAAPSNMAPGTYREYFRPVVDGIAWMNDLGIYWDVTVLKKPDPYQYSFVSQSVYPSIHPNETSYLNLTIKNTGTATWTSSMHLGTDRGRDRVPGFIRGNTWSSANRITMLESSVAPGETATFRFTMAAPSNMAPGTYREYFRPVVDGIAWMNDLGIYWDINIANAPVVQVPNRYQYSFVSQSAYPAVNRNETAYLNLKIKNTGTATWDSSMHLGTDRGRDRITGFVRRENWSSPNRITMLESSVAPGETATFRFTMAAPSNMVPGTYKEYFRPVVDGIAWLNDIGIYWDITVL